MTWVVSWLMPCHGRRCAGCSDNAQIWEGMKQDIELDLWCNSNQSITILNLLDVRITWRNLGSMSNWNWSMSWYEHVFDNMETLMFSWLQSMNSMIKIGMRMACDNGYRQLHVVFELRTIFSHVGLKILENNKSCCYNLQEGGKLFCIYTSLLNLINI